MRPMYETQADRSREDAAAARLAKYLGAMITKLTGQYARLDRMLVWPDKRHAFVEIKCRTVGYAVYPTLLLSAMKWREGVEMARATGGKFIVLAAYKDGDWAYVFEQKHLDTSTIWCEYGGRTVNTRDAGDIEPVMHIPSSLFLPLI